MRRRICCMSQWHRQHMQWSVLKCTLTFPSWRTRHHNFSPALTGHDCLAEAPADLTLNPHMKVLHSQYKFLTTGCNVWGFPRRDDLVIGHFFRVTFPSHFCCRFLIFSHLFSYRVLWRKNGSCACWRVVLLHWERIACAAAPASQCLGWTLNWAEEHKENAVIRPGDIIKWVRKESRVLCLRYTLLNLRESAMNLHSTWNLPHKLTTWSRRQTILKQGQSKP